ncbi:MAG: hypothetical protein OJF51_004110 [Nitrospira sp.]|jgi:ribosomal protein S12 methylthiotransferase accessory factor|nr:MAG: hypothetical protein OJF51_004110 [Nitrospira sp.]
MTNILNIVDRLVDERVGIVGHVLDIPEDGATRECVYMSAYTCNLRIVNPRQKRKDFFLGCGVAANRSKAMAKALGEAVEHYCSANYDAEDLPLVSFDRARFPCVRPDEFALFAPEQYAEPDFPYRPFTRKTRVRWVAGLGLMTQETLHVPASMVFLPYDQVLRGEPAITQQISTGLACHSSPITAAISGICEVIERDAIAITWQARLPRSQIRLETLSLSNQQLFSRIQRPGASVSLLHLVMDHGIPVIFATMRNTAPEAPALIVGAAANLDPERAVQKSLEELAQFQPIAQFMKSERPKFDPGKRWEQVIDFESHTNIYSYHANLHHTDFLFQNHRAISFRDIPNLSTGDAATDLEILIQHIGALKHKIVIVDVTTEDVRSLGLWVFRAVIPGFHPLFIGHRFRALGGNRLWEVPQKLGFSGINRGQGDNPAPHPFA